MEEDVAAEVGEVDWACFGVGHAGGDEVSEELGGEEVAQFLGVEWSASHFCGGGDGWMMCGGFGIVREAAVRVVVFLLVGGTVNATHAHVQDAWKWCPVLSAGVDTVDMEVGILLAVAVYWSRSCSMQQCHARFRNTVQILCRSYDRVS